MVYFCNRIGICSFFFTNAMGRSNYGESNIPALLELPIMIIGGGVEEIGWRGFLQPTLQKRWSPFTSTMIVGVIWAVWHLPLWFVMGSNQMNMNFLWFSLITLVLSFLLTIIYQSTKSIFLCIIFHALTNSFWDVFVPVTNVSSGFFTLLFALFLFTMFEVYRKSIFQKWMV